ncbi:hypothetical protein ACHAWF_009179 [Thalassiosira exigua]
MNGFSPTPPGVEICGTYKIVFLAALRYDTAQQQANIFLRRQPQSGSMVIKEAAGPFTIGVDGRLGTSRASVTDQVIFDGQVHLPYEGHEIDRYFGPGYKFYGFGTDSEATLSYTSMASNASLIVTKMNDNKGRIYRVQSPKAFKLVDSEMGVVVNENSLESQEQETNEARRINKCQPGDIWIDIRLTTPNRTYVLARPKSISSSDELDQQDEDDSIMTLFEDFHIY